MSYAKDRAIWDGAHVQRQQTTEEHIQRNIKANEAQRRLTEEVHKRSNELLRQREEAARETPEEKNDDKSEN
jgi:hypothetical protein